MRPFYKLKKKLFAIPVFILKLENVFNVKFKDYVFYLKIMKNFASNVL